MPSTSFTDYDNLCDSIARLLARPDLKDDIPGWVWMAECEVQQRAHMRATDAVYTGTAVEDQEYIELPDDYIEGRYLEWGDNTTPPLNVASHQTVDRIRGSNSVATGRTTSAGALHGNRIYIAANQSGGTNFTLYYKAGVQHLGPSNPTNKILQNYPDLLLYGSALHSAPFLGADERIQVWRSFFEPAMARAEQQEWRARTGHGPLHMRPDFEVY